MSPAGSVSHTPVAEQFPNNPLLLSPGSRAHAACSVARVSSARSLAREQIPALAACWKPGSPAAARSVSAVPFKPVLLISSWLAACAVLRASLLVWAEVLAGDDRCPWCLQPVSSGERAASVSIPGTNVPPVICKAQRSLCRNALERQIKANSLVASGE